MRTGRQLTRISVPDNWIFGLSYSPDGKYLVSVGRQKQVCVWNLETQHEVPKLEDPQGDSLVVFSPDGKYLASALGSGGFKIWDFGTGKVYLNQPLEKTHFKSIAFDQTARLIALADTSGNIYVYKVETRQAVGKFKIPVQVNAICFDASGTQIFAGGRTGELLELDPGTGNVTLIIKHVNTINSLSLLDKGKTLIVSGNNNIVYVYTMSDKKIIAKLEGYSFTISRDERYIVSASNYNPVWIWDTQSWNRLRTLVGITDRVLSVDFSPDGIYMASTGFENKVRLWNFQTATLVKDLPAESIILPVVFSSDAHFLFGGGIDGEIYRWDPGSLSEVKWKGENQRINALAFNSASGLLVSGGYDQKIRFFDPIRMVQGADEIPCTSNINTIVCSSSGNFIAFGLSGYQIGLIDGKTNRFSSWFDLGQEQMGSISSLAFDPKENLLVAGGYNGSVVLFDVATRKFKRKLQQHQFAVKSVCFSPDGQYVISGGDDKEIKVYDLLADKELPAYQGHEDWVNAVAFTKGRPLLASASYDGTIRFWTLSQEQPLFSFVATGDENYVVYMNNGFYKSSKQGTEAVHYIVNGRIYLFEQFDFKFNRPDLILQQIGYLDSSVISIYHKAYLKRLEKLNIHIDTITKVSIPVVTLPKKLPDRVADRYFYIKVAATDSIYNVVRWNVYVNNTPVFGSRGLPVKEKSRIQEATFLIVLSTGRNRIAISCLNEQNMESLSEEFEIFLDR